MTLREQIVDILGLETSPEGEPDYLLTRNDFGKVIEGTDWTDEVDALVMLVHERHRTLRHEAERWKVYAKQADLEIEQLRLEVAVLVDESNEQRALLIQAGTILRAVDESQP